MTQLTYNTIIKRIERIGDYLNKKLPPEPIAKAWGKVLSRDAKILINLKMPRKKYRKLS